MVDWNSGVTWPSPKPEYGRPPGHWRYSLIDVAERDSVELLNNAALPIAGTAEKSNAQVSGQIVYASRVC